MNWIVSGADRETGEDKAIEVEADSEESANRRAARRGLLVADVRPAATADHATIQVDDEPEESADTIAFDDDFSGPATATSTAPAYIAPQAAASPAGAFTAAAATSALPYQSAQPRGVSRPIPSYTGLSIASSILRVYALLLYIVTVLALLVATIGVINMAGSGMPASAIIVADATTYAPAIAIVFGAAMAHGASAALVALRDIAQNSFR